MNTKSSIAHPQYLTLYGCAYQDEFCIKVTAHKSFARKLEVFSRKQLAQLLIELPKFGVSTYKYIESISKTQYRG
jgi:hypothetical protein